MAEQRKAAKSSGNAKLMPLRRRDEIRLLCKSQRAPHFEKTLPASSVYPTTTRDHRRWITCFVESPGSPKEFPSQHPSPPPRSWSKDSKLAREKAKHSGKQLAAEGDVNVAVKCNGLIAETKIVRDHSKEKLITASAPNSTPSRLSFHGNPSESGKAGDSSPREHRSHEFAEDIIELEVLPQSATTYGPAQRTRARVFGKRFCSTQHPIFFKKPAVSNIFRLSDWTEQLSLPRCACDANKFLADFVRNLADNFQQSLLGNKTLHLCVKKALDFQHVRCLVFISAVMYDDRRPQPMGDGPMANLF